MAEQRISVLKEAKVQLRRRIWKPAVQRRDRCSQSVFQFHAAMPVKIFETDVWMTRDRRNSTLPSVPWSSLILFQLLSTGPPDPVCVSYTHDRDFGNFKELNRPEGSVVSIITQDWMFTMLQCFDMFYACEHVRTTRRAKRTFEVGAGAHAEASNIQDVLNADTMVCGASLTKPQSNMVSEIVVQSCALSAGFKPDCVRLSFFYSSNERINEQNQIESARIRSDNIIGLLNSADF